MSEPLVPMMPTGRRTRHRQPGRWAGRDVVALAVLGLGLAAMLLSGGPPAGMEAAPAPWSVKLASFAPG